MKELHLNACSQPWTYPLKPGLNKIGRNPTNDFRIPEASVSSFHCEIQVEPEGIRIHDLCSTNGTFIEGNPVSDGLLQEGQRLQLGTVEFRLENEPLKVSIPKPELPPKEEPVFCEDGQPACVNHATQHAAFRCPHCARTFCSQCIHALRIAGKAPRYYCPSCSTICVPLVDPSAAPARKQTFLGRLTQTIRLRLKV